MSSARLAAGLVSDQATTAWANWLFWHEQRERSIQYCCHEPLSTL